jgi:hypothetical protein
MTVSLRSSPDSARTAARGQPAPLWALRVALLVLTWAAYYPIWDNALVDFDDEIFIADNEHVSGGLSRSGIGWALFNDEPPYRMPLTWLTLQFDAELSRSFAPASPCLLPAIVHTQNLFWHSVNVLLLFGLCLRLPGGTGMRSALVAALFAVHPMHVESVAWGIERKDVLMCACGLLCIRCYLRFAATRQWVWYGGALAALAASLAAKPMLLTMPFILLLLDYWPLRRFAIPLRPESLWSLLREKVPFFVLVGVVAMETIRTRSGVGAVQIDFFARAMNALSGYGWYLTTTVWPSSLAAVYPHLRENWSLEASMSGAGVIMAVTLLVLRQAKRGPWLPVCWFWFLGTLFPLIGLAQGGPQAWADRFSYWPHIGLFVALVWGAAGLASHIPRPLALVVLGCTLGGLMQLTSAQVHYWHDSVALWEHAVTVTRDNAYAHERLAIAYRRQGRTAEADFHLKVASRVVMERLRHTRHPSQN